MERHRLDESSLVSGSTRSCSKMTNTPFSSLLDNFSIKHLIRKRLRRLGQMHTKDLCDRWRHTQVTDRWNAYCRTNCCAAREKYPLHFGHRVDEPMFSSRSMIADQLAPVCLLKRIVHRREKVELECLIGVLFRWHSIRTSLGVRHNTSNSDSWNLRSPDFSRARIRRHVCVGDKLLLRFLALGERSR